jgi:hypothetical protein
MNAFRKVLSRLFGSSAQETPPSPVAEAAPPAPEVIPGPVSFPLQRKMFPVAECWPSEFRIDSAIRQANTEEAEPIRKLAAMLINLVHPYVMGPSDTRWQVASDRQGTLKETCYLEEATASQYVTLLEVAAEKGDAEACFYAGSAYCKGFGRIVDREHGIALVQRAADQGHEKAQAFLADPEQQTPLKPKSESVCMWTIKDGQKIPVTGPSLR